MASDDHAPLWDSKVFKLDDHWPRSSLANQPMPFSRQPLRFLYEGYYYLTFPLRLLLIFIPTTIYRQTLDPNNPPNRSWLDTISILIGRSLIHDLWTPTGGGMRGVFYDSASLTVQKRLKLLKKTKGLVEVIRSDKMQVENLRQPLRSWAQNARVQNAKELTIWWLGQRSENLDQEKAKSGEKIVIYLSGGGYLVGTCYPSHDLGALASTVMKHIKKETGEKAAVLPQSIVSLEYRRTTTTATPGALLDALSLYYHLIDDLGFEPSNISVLGDSAGAHLVNMLIRYLVEGGEAKPGKIILISPWGDQAGTIIEHPNSSFNRNLPYDFLSDHFYHYCKDIFAQQFSKPNDTLLDVYFSPSAVLGKVMTRRRISSLKEEGEDEYEQILITKETEKDMFKNWPSTLLICGNYEILRDQSTEMFKRLEMAKQAEGKIGENHLSFFILETCHDPVVLPFFVFANERERCIQRIVAWLALE